MTRRIAVMIPHFDALGIAKCMFTLAEALARRGFAVDFLAGSLDPPSPFPIPEGVTLRDAGLFPKDAELPVVCRYLREAPRRRGQDFAAPRIASEWLKLAGLDSAN